MPSFNLPGYMAIKEEALASFRAKLREPEAQPACFEQLQFRHFFLQPMDGPEIAENIRRAVEFCLAHPKWRLSLQTHKLLGLR